MDSVSLENLAKVFELNNLTQDIDISQIFIDHSDINRPALQLTGFFEHFDNERLQIIGLVEYTYLKKMDIISRKEILKKIFEHKVTCFVMCRDLEPYEEMLEYARVYQTPIL